MQTPHSAEDTWLRLNALLDARIREIVARENDNVQHIYLYDTGGYWAAFERSAWQLCRLFPDSMAAAVDAHGYPFTLVTAFVANDIVQKYFRSHRIGRSSDHAIIAASLIPSDKYCRWHRDIVGELR